jgi:hypothetical protein
MFSADSRQAIEKERNDRNALHLHDPKALYSAAPLHMEGPSISGMSGDAFSTRTVVGASTTDAFLAAPQDLLIPRVSNLKTVPKYLNLNSFDRNFLMQPFRYEYDVSFADMTRYRNIQSISVSRVIIPEEVLPANSVINKEKTAFNYEFSFSYPYLLLQIKEFADVYDGTNNNARKAFATMIYNRHYKAPNGRGYIILKPIQYEKKVFYPNTLSSISKLSVAITKPNGELLNTSADNYKVFKVEYENFNPHYIKIVTHVYFDKNEFYVGDMIHFLDFTMTAEPMTQAYVDFNAFMNRPGGHEIKQTGMANDNGFFKTFYIEAPGAFDKVLGRFVVDMTLISALNAYNDSINWNIHEETMGYIMNDSLQNTITMSLEVAVDDVSSILKPQIL